MNDKIIQIMNILKNDPIGFEDLSYNILDNQIEFHTKLPTLQDDEDMETYFNRISDISRDNHSGGLSHETISKLQELGIDHHLIINDCEGLENEGLISLD